MTRSIGLSLLILTLFAFPASAVAQVGGPNPVLSKTMSPARPRVGDTARITLTATNLGSANADNVVITDPLPDNMALASGPTTTQGTINVTHNIITVYVGTLAPGQTVSVTHEVIVTREFANDTPYTNCTGLTFRNGTARLACFPIGPAYDPVSVTSPPQFLPEAGSPDQLLSFAWMAIGAASVLAARRLRSRRRP